MEASPSDVSVSLDISSPVDMPGEEKFDCRQSSRILFKSCAKMSSGSEGDLKEVNENDGDGENDTSIENEFEELTLKHMKSSGFMAQIKGEISKYVIEVSKQFGGGDIYIVPERADAKVLVQIYEYLQWVGMRNSAAVLLSESPVSFLPEKNNGQIPRLLSSISLELPNSKNEMLDKESSATIPSSDADSQTKNVLMRNVSSSTPPVTTTPEVAEIATATTTATSTTSLSNKLLSGVASSIDFLTGSPISSTTSLAKMTPIPLIAGGSKSFDDLLKAYVAKDEGATPTSKAFDFDTTTPTALDFDNKTFTVTPLAQDVEKETESDSSEPKTPGNEQFREQSQEVNKEESNKEQLEGQSKRKEDSSLSFSELLSLSMEEDNDNTNDISLPSEFVGLSSCEHVVSLDTNGPKPNVDK